jgi:hypothetical protein
MKNNLQPDVWGPSGWNFMHYVALGYPDTPTSEDKDNYKLFYESLGHVLPCQGCATHYKDTLTNVPVTPHLDSREDLLRWTFDIHNLVNARLEKPQLSYEDALLLYTHKQFPVFDVLWKCILLLVLAFLMYMVATR